MNKNTIIVGAIAVGLYLLSQGKKTTKVVAKKKAPRRPLHKYYKPKIKRVIARKKTVYNKPKIKRVIARKKPIYRRPVSRIAAARKKPIYRKPKPRIAAWKKPIIKRMARRKRRR